LILTMALVFFLTKAKKRVLPFLVILFVIFAITFLFSDIINNFMDRGRSLPVMRSLEFRTMCYSIALQMFL